MAGDRIKIFEVGPRDGLQNEKKIISLGSKLELIRGLIGAGLKQIEAGAFVRPDRVPQMADTDALYRAIHRADLAKGGVTFWALVPNLKGLERAIAVGARNIAVFTAASDTFTKKNIGMTVSESLREYERVVDTIRKMHGPKIRVRGYVSTALGCPYEGKISPSRVIRITEKLLEMGVEQVSIGDTIGVGVPSQVEQVLGGVMRSIGRKEAEKRIAGHFHDTRGTALANCLKAFELGIRTFDSSAGGLGGCPYAPGASGNLATEDLVYFFENMGVRTGVNLERLAKISFKLSRKMKRDLPSKSLQAMKKTK